MATVKFLAGFICLAFIGRGWGTGGHIIKEKEDKHENIIRIARKEIGVVERTGKNDGERIAEYLRYCNIGTPAPYCSAFVSFCFGKAGYNRPRTAWSPALFPAVKVTKEAKPGYVFGLYYPSLQRIAHCGIIENVKDDLIFSIEGNTNVVGSREGDGVWRKIRHKRTIARYADWLQ